MRGEDLAILIVDDSRAMRLLLGRILRPLGEVRIVEASDAFEAIAAAREAGPAGFDAALLDWSLPGIDPLALVGQLRAVSPSTPLIMLATHIGADRIVGAVRAGVSNYILKPFTHEMLIEKVRATLAQARRAA